MADLVVITGGGTGIGSVLAREFVKSNYEVIIIGRTQQTLQNTVAACPDKMNFVVADIATAEGRGVIFHKINHRKIKFLIHNAGIMAPIANLLDVSEKDFKYNLAVNLEAPFFLTKLLLGNMLEGSRIFHVSSGAAHSAVSGWGIYCISKAAFLMMFQILKSDLKKYGIVIGSAFPGIVDTPMQQLIRSAKPEDFPLVEKFRKFKERGKLISPEKVAQHFMWLLLHTDDETFSQKDWDIDELIEKFAL